MARRCRHDNSIIRMRAGELPGKRSTALWPSFTKAALANVPDISSLLRVVTARISACKPLAPAELFKSAPLGIRIIRVRAARQSCGPWAKYPVTVPGRFELSSAANGRNAREVAARPVEAGDQARPATGSPPAPKTIGIVAGCRLCRGVPRASARRSMSTLLRTRSSASAGSRLS